MPVSVAVALFWVSCAVEANGPAEEHPDGGPAATGLMEACVEELEPKGTTLVVLPDTQYYACGYPDIFRSQIEWIAGAVIPRRVALVVHTGDIVDSAGSREQWEVASDSLHQLDYTVPYLLTTGNHDISRDRSSLAAEYFPPDRCVRGPSIGFDPDQPQNSFMIAEFDQAQWLVIGLEYAPRDVVLAWAGDVLQQHSDLPAIVFTHAYLYSDGSRYDRSIEPQQMHHPDNSGLATDAGVSDGQDIWNKLVEPHTNVKIVLSEHMRPDGTARAVSRRSDGSIVHEILANYQYCKVCPCPEVQGGAGYLRLMQYDAAAERFDVSTYSPYLDEWLTDEENRFSIELSEHI